MKNIILFLSLLPAMLYGQSGRYKIEGKGNSNLQDKKIYLVYKSGGVSIVDSAHIKNGQFSFSGSVSEPKHAVLVFDHSGTGIFKADISRADRLNIYLEKADMTIKFTDSISKALFTGSQMNLDYKGLQLQLEPVIKGFTRMMADFEALPREQQNSSAMQDAMLMKYRQITAVQKKILSDYVRNNPEKFISLDALIDYGGAEADQPEVEALFNALSANTRKNSSAIAYSVIIKRSRTTAIGTIAPDFTQNDQDGNPVTLSSFRGKYLLIDFWASWCGPCRQENPNVVAAYTQYKDKNFTIIGVSLDRADGKGSWLKAIEDDKLTWTQVSDLKLWKNEVAVKYGINAIPKNFLLDPEGKIIAKNIYRSELKVVLAGLLK